MTMLMIYQAETGETVEYIPRGFEPLSYSDLPPNSAAGSQAYVLRASADSIKIKGGDAKSVRGEVSTRITFGQPLSIYALVKGGWLPPPFVIPPMFLVDSNVVSNLKKLAGGGQGIHLSHTDWWLRLLSNRDLVFNPVLFAFEGNKREPPSFDEFCRVFGEASSTITNYFPDAKLIAYESEHYRAAYAVLAALLERNERETEFLIGIAPALAHRVAEAKLPRLRSQILDAARRLNLQPRSLVVLTALSCLYEPRDGSGHLAARRLLKPHEHYSTQDAYNALADLRAVEILIGSLVQKADVFTLCTCDKAVAALWCGLNVHDVGWHQGGLNFSVSLGEDLFPRLKETEHEELIQQLDG